MAYGIGVFWVAIYRDRKLGTWMAAAVRAVLFGGITGGIIALIVCILNLDKQYYAGVLLGLIPSVVFGFWGAIETGRMKYTGQKKKAYRLFPLPTLFKIAPPYKPHILVICSNQYSTHFNGVFKKDFVVGGFNNIADINPDYDCIFVFWDDRFYRTDSTYGGDDNLPRRQELEQALILYLENRGKVVCVHDAHFFGHVGLFGPFRNSQYCAVEINPKEINHPIAKGVKRITLTQEEGSHTQDPIRMEDRTPDDRIQGYIDIFSFYHLDEPEGAGGDTYPAAWLLKYSKPYYNVFYSFFNHDHSNTYNKDLNKMWLNAIKYLTS